MYQNLQYLLSTAYGTNILCRLFTSHVWDHYPRVLRCIEDEMIIVSHAGEVPHDCVLGLQTLTEYCADF